MTGQQILASFFIATLTSLVFCQPATADTLKTPPKGTVALTFDDGPSPESTEKILAILKKNHIHATFFMVGMNAKKYPELVRKVEADGHVIASHSMTHPNLTTLSNAGLQREVNGSAATINAITGEHVACLRYPFGASNKRVREYIHAQGIQPVPMGWNSFDYERPGTSKIIRQVLDHAHSGQVFLFHDGFPGANRSQTIAALQPVIDGIRAKGLGFGTICG